MRWQTSLLCVALMAGTAAAQSGNPAALAETRRLRDEIDRSMKLTFTGLGGAAQQRNVDQMESILAAVHQQFTPALEAGDASVYRSVAEKLKEADGWLANMKASIACGTAIETVSKQHAQGQQAPAADIAAIETAMSAFEKAERASTGSLRYANWDRTLVDCRSNGLRLIAANPSVVQRAAEQKASAERAEAAGKLAAVAGPADAALKPLLDAAKRGEPISDEGLAAVEAAAANVKPVSAARADYYLREVAFLRSFAWLQAGQAKPIAAALTAQMVASGRSSGKTLTVSFSAKPGHCYLLLGDFASLSGSESIGTFAWRFSGGLVHQFRLDRDRPALAAGFCAKETAGASGTAPLTFAGTKNGVQYLVLDWPAASFPLSVASQMRLVPHDHCDFRAREDLFSSPLPGTFAWLGSEPVVIVRIDGSSVQYLSLAKPAAEGGNLGDFSSQPIGKVAVRSAFAWQECPYHDKAAATSPISIKLNECEDRLNKKYGKGYDQVQRVRDQARNMGGVAPAAERAKGRLDEQYDREFKSSCGALLADAHKRGEASFNKLVDHFADAPPAHDALDRLAFAQGMSGAPVRQRR